MLQGKIESLLFVASKPLTVKKISELVGAEEAQVNAVLDGLKREYNTEAHGIQIALHARSVQMVTSPLFASIVADFLKDERSGELTRPSLETLTIIAYRGPVAKSEIDLIRGVNCSLILRNLLIRGLISMQEDRKHMTTLYEISFDFLRHLGLRNVRELPDYDKLKADERLAQLLSQQSSALAENAPASRAPSPLTADPKTSQHKPSGNADNVANRL